MGPTEVIDFGRYTARWCNNCFIKWVITDFQVKRENNMKPIFCGNLEFETRPSDLERLFRRYGKVERVDVKSGFAFVYMDDERDADDAIRRLDRTEFGRTGRQIRVEWTKQDRGSRGPGDFKRSARKPCKTLFVINFDPNDTRTRDLEKHFEPYGRILNIRIRRNFAFIQFELQEDATKALDATHLSNFMDQVISVEYASRDDDDIQHGHNNSDARGGGRDRSPVRGNYDQKRSPSPYHRSRASPDYGHGSNPTRTEAKRSPDYGRGSNSNTRTESKRSPGNGRGSSPNSRTEAKHSPDNAKAERSANERYQSRSPPPRERSRS